MVIFFAAVDAGFSVGQGVGVGVGVGTGVGVGRFASLMASSASEPGLAIRTTFVQPEKALSAMEATLSGTVTVVRLARPPNAYSPIAVTV